MQAVHQAVGIKDHEPAVENRRAGIRRRIPLCGG